MNSNFLSEVTECLEKMNKTNLKKCLYNIAQKLTKEEQEEYIQFLQNHITEEQEGNTTVMPAARMSDEFVREKLDEIAEWIKEIADGELYLKESGYEDYSSGHWESEWISEYGDPFGISSKIEMGFGFAKDCLKDRKYKETLYILDKLMELEVEVHFEDIEGYRYESENENDDLTYIDIEDMISEKLVKIDSGELALMTLYTNYQMREKSDRVTSTYAYIQKPLFYNTRVEDMKGIGQDDLDDEKYFWNSWIALLLQKEGEQVSRLLREAIIYSKGAVGIAKLASDNYKKHPALYLGAIEEYERNHDYQKIADIGFEAINNINQKESIRAQIALKTSLAEYKLGNIQNMKNFWYEVYLSDKREVNLLRLFLDDKMGNKFLDNDKKFLENNTTLFTKFLIGEFETVKKACVNPPNSLGWSNRFIKEGIELFLLYLYDAPKLSKAMREIGSKMADLFGFSNNEEFYYLENTHEEQKVRDEETFWLAFSKWKKNFEMSEKEKNKYLEWIDKIVDKRVMAIVEGKFRGSYGRAAALLMAFGDVKESMGYEGAKAGLVQKYKRIFPRHSAFQAMVNFYL